MNKLKNLLFAVVSAIAIACLLYQVTVPFLRLFYVAYSVVRVQQFILGFSGMLMETFKNGDKS